MKNNEKQEIISGNARVVRNINRAVILNMIRELQPISRIKISRLTGLNKSTVSSIVNDILKEDLITEEMVKDQNVGRNPILLRMKLGEHFVGAINIDAKESRIAIADIDGRILDLLSYPTRVEHPDALVAKCMKGLDEMRDKMRIKKLKGIGVSITGIIDDESGIVVNSPDLGWQNLNLLAEFEKHLDKGCPITIENDAKSSALAELWFGKQPIELSDFVFLSIGSGVGAGIVVNKNIVNGHSHAAGEFAHMPVANEGKKCACGDEDCLEAFVSNLAIPKRYRELAECEQLPSVPEIIAFADEGDKAAIQVLEECAKHIGVAITHIIKAIDPKAIVIGGLIIHGWHIMAPIMNETIKKRTFYGINREIQIFKTSLKVSHRVSGAAALAIKQIFSDYKITK